MEPKQKRKNNSSTIRKPRGKYYVAQNTENGWINPYLSNYILRMPTYRSDDNALYKLQRVINNTSEPQGYTDYDKNRGIFINPGDTAYVYARYPNGGMFPDENGEVHSYRGMPNYDMYRRYFNEATKQIQPPSLLERFAELLDFRNALR